MIIICSEGVADAAGGFATAQQRFGLSILSSPRNHVGRSLHRVDRRATLLLRLLSHILIYMRHWLIVVLQTIFRQRCSRGIAAGEAPELRYKPAICNRTTTQQIGAAGKLVASFLHEGGNGSIAVLYARPQAFAQNHGSLVLWHFLPIILRFEGDPFDRQPPSDYAHDCSDQTAKHAAALPFLSQSLAGAAFAQDHRHRAV